MARQTSTAISEIILTAFSFVLSYYAYPQSKLVFAALAITGAASFIGIFRFALEQGRSDVYRWHHYMTKVAFGCTPAFFASVYVALIHRIGSIVFFVAPLVVTFVLNEVAPDSQDLVMTVLSGASILSILYVSFMETILSGVLGACLLVISSILVQTDGTIQGIKRVDIFHYIMIPALYFMANGVIDI